MGISLSERHVAALNFLLVGLVAYFAALSVNDVIVRRLADFAAVDPSLAQRIHLQASVATRASYSVIAERDIFNSIKEVAPVAPAPVPTLDLDIRLLGTSHLTQSRPFAVIENERNALQALYRQGDEIEGIGRLVGVEKTRIIIDRQGQRVAVEIPQDAMEAPSEVSPPTPSPDDSDETPPEVAVQLPTAVGGVHRLGRNRYQVDRSMVDSSLQNMSQLFTQMRAIPNIQNGKSNGFALSEIQPGSLFSQMGLRDGDLVTTISGQDLSDPTQALAMLNQLRNQQNLQIGLMRNGRPLTLNYNIH
jgi:general secretion pathway protein C